MRRPPRAQASVQEVARLVLERGSASAFTGAGISVESGIPDFRSEDGIWSRFDPFEYATIDAFQKDPAKVWRFLRELGQLLEGAEPNAAHRALARLEALGVLGPVATQNVDGLHQRAGSSEVYELHGSGSRLVCLTCGAGFPAAARAEGVRRGEVPECTCGSALKPDVVLFGEPLPARVVADAQARVLTTGVLLVIGTSAEVYPAAQIPLAARAAGATLVEVNVAPTGLTGEVAAHSLLGPAGEVLPELVREIERLKAG